MLKPVIERKHTYNGETVEHACLLLKQSSNLSILYHKIVYPFTMETSDKPVTIPAGSYTLAFYWKDRPYNAYIWRDNNGKYLGCYFNIVKDTRFTSHVITFTDLIIDVLLLPDGTAYVLDQEELPIPLHQFENGDVAYVLKSFLLIIDEIVEILLKEVDSYYAHETLLTMLDS